MRQAIDLLAQRYHCISKPATAGRKFEAPTHAFRKLTRPRPRGKSLSSSPIHARVLSLDAPLRAAKRMLLCEHSGSSLIETAVLIPVLVLLLVGAIDYGRGFYTAIEVSSSAESAAIYGTNNPTDAPGIVSMAKLDAKDIATLNVNTAFGCECADGTGAIVSCLSAVVCSNNAIRYVDVWTSTVYTPLLPYPLIPSSFSLSGHSRMRMSSN